MERKSIVVIEGDPGVRQLLKETLSEIGEPSVWGTAEEGLATIMSGQHAMAVLGGTLPGLNADEVVQLLRSSSRHRAMRLVVCTDWPFDDFGGLDLPGLGPDARILLPFQKENFLKTIWDLLQPRRASLEGQVFENHELLEVMGMGGRAAVYKARDKDSGQLFALKVLAKGKEEDPKRLQRFERSTALWAKLDHPNILKVYGSGETEGGVYARLEFIEGNSLEAMARRQPFGLVQIRSVVEQVAEGLQHLHDNNVVHRDLNAANILWSDDGQLKIADFGIGQFDMPDGRQGVQQLRKLMGASLYMAPEARLNLPMSPKSDQFSFGRIIVRLFEGAKAAEKPPELDQLRPDLSPDFVAAVKRMMDIHPKKRFDSARDAKNALLATWPS